MLKNTTRITGDEFLKLLKRSNIQPSVFSFKTKIDYANVVSLKGCKKYVPEKFIKKLNNHFSNEIKAEVIPFTHVLEK